MVVEEEDAGASAAAASASSPVSLPNLAYPRDTASTSQCKKQIWETLTRQFCNVRVVGINSHTGVPFSFIHLLAWYIQII